MGRKIRIWIPTLAIVITIIASSFIPALSFGRDNDSEIQPLSEKEQKLIGSDIEDKKDPGLYIRYREEYRTKQYEGWETYTNNDEEITIAMEKVVIRRGSTLLIGGYTDAEYDIIPSKEDMDSLDVNEKENGWGIEIPKDSSIGKYRFEISEGDWEESIDIFLIFDPWQLDIPEDKRKKYAYDEEGTRDESAYIFTTRGNILPSKTHIPNLHPFGDDYDDRPSMFEFALAGAGNSSDPQNSAAKLFRIVSQRNDARPGFEPLIRDASDILFYGKESPSIHHSFHVADLKKEGNLTEGELPEWIRKPIENKGIDLKESAEICESKNWTWIKIGEKKEFRIMEDEINNEKIIRIYKGELTQTVLEGEARDVEGLTLEDAKKLSMNGVSIHDLESKGRSKVINGWCDEVSFALVGLLRSIGIPSRVASLHPKPDVSKDLMSHYIAEAWFEESLYDTDWEGNSYEGGWHVLDADEWNVEFPSGIRGLPSFNMPVGETITSRGTYLRTVEKLFEGEWVKGEYGKRWKTQDIYVVGSKNEDIPQPIKVSEAYVDGKEHNLRYGSVTKLLSRGGGDLYKLEINETTKLSLETPPQKEANLYVSDEEYPSIPTALKGYPFDEPDGYQGKEAVLVPDGEETFYIGIYGPENGDRTVEGNFGSYTLTVERSDEDRTSESGIFLGAGDISNDYYYAMILIFLWIISYVGIKRL